MSTFVSADLQAGLDEARNMQAVKAARMKLVASDGAWPILRMWDTGFAIPLDQAPHIRGFVEIYEGESHLFQCLIVAAEVVGDELHFGFKRMTAIREKAPVDFAEAPDRPVALIEKSN